MPTTETKRKSITKKYQHKILGLPKEMHKYFGLKDSEEKLGNKARFFKLKMKPLLEELLYIQNSTEEIRYICMLGKHSSKFKLILDDVKVVWSKRPNFARVNLLKVKQLPESINKSDIKSLYKKPNNWPQEEYKDRLLEVAVKLKLTKSKRIGEAKLLSLLKEYEEK